MPWEDERGFKVLPKGSYILIGGLRCLKDVSRAIKNYTVFIWLSLCSKFPSCHVLGQLASRQGIRADVYFVRAGSLPHYAPISPCSSAGKSCQLYLQTGEEVRMNRSPRGIRTTAAGNVVLRFSNRLGRHREWEPLVVEEEACCSKVEERIHYVGLTCGVPRCMKALDRILRNTFCDRAGL